MSLVDSSFTSPLFSLPIPQCAGKLSDIAWSTSGTHLAAVTSAGWVFLWDIRTGEVCQQKQVTRTPLLSITWAREGTCLAVGGQDGMVRLLDERLRVGSTYPFEAPVRRIAWAPHVVGACAIVTGRHVTLLREDTRTTRVLHYSCAVLDVAWSGDGRQIAILGADGLVEIWHARKHYLAHRFATEPMEEGSLLWDQPCHTLVARNALGAVHTYALRETSVSLP
ncbi:MAG TPA: WD40 repeat domain-containing protein, partial [Ktedonobacteraceae bacterium]|nr:WD40 repeat domain-containing protein [Ktedonobacteraceae bacterium]